MIEEITTVATAAEKGGGWVVLSIFFLLFLYVLREYFTSLVKAQEKKNEKEEARRDREAIEQKNFLSKLLDKIEALVETNRETNILQVKSLGRIEQVFDQVENLSRNGISGLNKEHAQGISNTEEIKKKADQILNKLEDIENCQSKECVKKLDQLLIRSEK